MVTYSKRYIPGDRLLTCSICGFDYRLSQMRKVKWPGLVGKDTSAPARSDDATASYLTENQDTPEGSYVCPKCYDGNHIRNTPVKLRKKQPLRYPE